MRTVQIINNFEESEDMMVVEANSIPDRGCLEGIISEMEIRLEGNLNNRAIYLPNADEYNYEVVLDKYNAPCLLVTKK